MQHISYDNFFSCISIFGWTICCLCPSTYESTILEGQTLGCRRSSTGTTSEVVMDIPTIQMIGHDYLIGPTAGQHDLPTLPSMTIWPFTLHLYGGSFITQLDQQLQCPWMSIQEATLPIPCNAAPFLQWHSPFRIGILCPTSLNGYAGYAAMLWIYGCHHWDQAGRPFHNSLGANVNPGLINP